MAGQPRQPFIVFGSGGVVSAPTEFSQFGSLEVDGPPGVKTTDIATIMALPPWTSGLQGAVYAGTYVLPLEDDNSWRYVHSYQVGQVLQDGVPQWQVAQVYQVGSWVQDAANLGQIFMCLQANTVGGSLPTGASTAAWRWVNPPSVVLPSALAANAVPKIGGSASTGAPGSQTLVLGLLTDDGVNVIIGGTPGTQGLKFPDNTIQLTAAVANPGPPTVSSPPSGYVGAPTRLLNTVYHNTTSKPIYVSVSVNGSLVSCIVYCDGSPIPTTPLCRTDNILASQFFIVLPGYYYKVVTSAPLVYWTEWT